MGWCRWAESAPTFVDSAIVFENRVDRCRSDKRFLILIPSRQERLDAGLQVLHAAKGSTADRLRAQFAKPSLNQVQPTGAGRDKVGHEARVAHEPGPHLLVLMRPIILKKNGRFLAIGPFMLREPQHERGTTAITRWGRVRSP